MEGPTSFWGYKEQKSHLILPEHDDDDDADISFATVAFSLASFLFFFFFYTMVVQSVVHEVIMKDI